MSCKVRLARRLLENLEEDVTSAVLGSEPSQYALCTTNATLTDAFFLWNHGRPLLERLVGSHDACAKCLAGDITHDWAQVWRQTNVQRASGRECFLPSFLYGYRSTLLQHFSRIDDPTLTPQVRLDTAVAALRNHLYTVLTCEFLSNAAMRFHCDECYADDSGYAYSVFEHMLRVELAKSGIELWLKNISTDTPTRIRSGLFERKASSTKPETHVVSVAQICHADESENTCSTTSVKGELKLVQITQQGKLSFPPALSANFPSPHAVQ